MEEVGELAKVVRKIVGMKFTDTTKKAELRDELADVQIVLLGLASMLEENMFNAVLEIEKKNQEHHWQQPTIAHGYISVLEKATCP